MKTIALQDAVGKTLEATVEGYECRYLKWTDGSLTRLDVRWGEVVDDAVDDVTDRDDLVRLGLMTREEADIAIKRERERENIAEAVRRRELALLEQLKAKYSA